MILTVTLNPCVHRYLLYREEVPPRTVVRLVRERMSSGGKGLNVARVIVRLGGEAVALSTASGPTGRASRPASGTWRTSASASSSRRAPT